MTSRSFPPNPNTSLMTKTRVLFLALTISASLVILASILYFLYHLWYSLVQRAKTIPFDSISAPLKLQRFSYKELKIATSDFDLSNVIGKGGSGTVFRGVLKNGKLIAIKRLDSLTLQTEREFQNELQILGGLRSPFLVTLLGYCVEKSNRVLVYEYMPNKSLQESLFRDGFSSLSWERRFEIILDIARALEFLHLGCDPPVIHGDVKPSNVLLDSDHRAKISDFGLSRVKSDGDNHHFGVVDMFSQDLGKSQELSAVSTPPAESSTNEVDFSLALQASSSSKNSTRTCSYNAKALNLNSNNNNNNNSLMSYYYSEKGKELVSSSRSHEHWSHTKFVPYYDDDHHNNQPSSVDHSKELTKMKPSINNNPCFGVDEGCLDAKQWGKDWWWRQDGSGELCSRDYVNEWIGSQISPSTNHELDHSSTQLDTKLEEPNEPRDDFQGFESGATKNVENSNKKKPRKMQEWWREEHLAEISKKKGRGGHKTNKFKKGLSKMPHFDFGRRFHFRGRIRKNTNSEQNQNDKRDNDDNNNGEFSFRRGWRRNRSNNNSIGGSEMWSGDLFSTTTSMRGTLCYVAPEYGACGYLMEKADIYSLGVLILVIVSGRRPLHVLASPMKLEKANLISWCRQLAQCGSDVLEVVDEKLKDEFNKEEANLCINLALTCLQKMPELRPDIGDVVRILKREIDLPPMPFEFSPSPTSKLYSRSRRKHKLNAD